MTWSSSIFERFFSAVRSSLVHYEGLTNVSADGASLIYTAQNSASQLPSLIHSMLGITSLLKRNPLKHNVIDRDKIVVPPNWDSWGKIRVLGGSFDTETVSEGWGQDIKLPSGSEPPTLEKLQESHDAENGDPAPESAQSHSAIAGYEDWCRDPTSGGITLVDNAMTGGPSVNVGSEDVQDFLEKQLKALETYKAKAHDKSSADIGGKSSTKKALDFGDEKGISEHIGPVQFNMGGIQVDADDMLQRLKVSNVQSLIPTWTCLTSVYRTETRTHRLRAHRPSRRPQRRVPPRISTTSSCRISSVV